MFSGSLCRAAVLVGFLALLSACGTGTTTVLEPTSTHVVAHGVAVVSGNNPVAVPAGVLTVFRSKLENELYVNDGFGQGNDVSLTYTFIQFSEGDRGLRWLTGGIGNAGEASMSVQAVFTDNQGHVVGKIISGGKIGSGFLGGSIEDATEKAAVEIANYTKANFK